MTQLRFLEGYGRSLRPAEVGGTRSRLRQHPLQRHTPPYVRALAERLFISTYLSVEDIAAQVALVWPDHYVTPEKVARWAEKGKWRRPDPPTIPAARQNPVPVTVRTAGPWESGWHSWMA